MVKYAASILVAAALVAAVHAEQHHSAPRDLADVDLFEREIPFDLGDLSVRDDADLYTRDFFENELSERDLELLERAPSLWFQNAIKKYASQYGPKPTPPSSPSPALSERDFADDSDLLERDFDDSDLLERDFEELEARESIWSKIKNFFTGKKGKNDKKKKEEAEKKKKAAEAKKKAEADDLAERDYDDEDLFERNFDDSDLLERDFEELEARDSIWTKIRNFFTGKKGKNDKKKKEEAEKKKKAAEAKKKAEADDLAERDYDDEDLFERDVAEEDLYERDFDEEMFERDFEDELLEREFDEEFLVEREIDELD